MKGLGRNRIPIAGALLMLLLALTLFRPFYQTNDDVGLRLLSEGGYTPEAGPSALLLYVHVAIGALLAGAKAALPGVFWFDLLLLGSVTVAATALLAVWCDGGRRVDPWGGLLLAALLLQHAFVSLQYTLIAGSCAAGGLGLLAWSAARGDPGHVRRVAGMALFVWSALLRFEVAALLLIEAILLAIPFVIAWWGDEKRRKAIRASATALLGAAVTVAALHAADRAVYRFSAGWEKVMELHERRGRLSEHLVPGALDTVSRRSVETAAGWTSTDFDLLLNFFFVDRERYGLESIRAAESALYPTGFLAARMRRPAVTAAMDAVRESAVTFGWALVLLAAWVVGWGAGRVPPLAYLVHALAILASLVFLTALLFRGPPPRILWPMLFMATTAIVMATREWCGESRSWLIAAAAVVGIWSAGPSLPALYRKSEAHRAAPREIRRDLDAARKRGAELFVLHASAFPYERYWRPLSAVPSRFALLPLGATALTPHVQAFLDRQKISDLPWALCTQPGLVLVAYPHVPPLLEESVAGRRDVRVVFEPLHEGAQFTTWQCRRVPLEHEASELAFEQGEEQPRDP